MNAPDVRNPVKAARVMPVPTLRFDQGRMAGVAIRLEQQDGTLGRRPDNPYVVTEPAVSRVHARITREGEQTIVVTDLGSSGGTTVNGEPLAGPKVVVHGDRIGFAGVECTVENPVGASVHEEATMVFEAPAVQIGPSLSPRQTQVLELIAEGMTNIEIGEQLGITERTVKAYAQELYDKLGVRNRAGAVAEGIKAGLL